MPFVLFFHHAAMTKMDRSHSHVPMLRSHCALAQFYGKARRRHLQSSAGISSCQTSLRGNRYEPYYRAFDVLDKQPIIYNQMLLVLLALDHTVITYLVLQSKSVTRPRFQNVINSTRWNKNWERTGIEPLKPVNPGQYYYEQVYQGRQ
jgi:hypothetical protein